MTHNMLQKAMHQVMADEELTREYLPEELLSSFSLEDYRTSLVQIHFPENEACMHRARSRLVFDEFLAFILAVRALKKQDIRKDTVFSLKEPDFLENVIQNLNFSLTKAQEKVWNEIKADLKGTPAQDWCRETSVLEKPSWHF